MRFFKRVTGSGGRQLLAEETQNFPDRPGLRDAAARLVRHIPVKNFTDRSETGLPQMGEKQRQMRAQIRLGMPGFSVDLLISREKRPNEPGPDRSLMISQITLPGLSAINAHVPAIARVERPESERG